MLKANTIGLVFKHVKLTKWSTLMAEMFAYTNSMKCSRLRRIKFCALQFCSPYNIMSCQKLSIMQKEKKLHVPILFSWTHCMQFSIENCIMFWKALCILWIGVMDWSHGLEYCIGVKCWRERETVILVVKLVLFECTQ